MVPARREGPYATAPGSAARRRYEEPQMDFEIAERTPLRHNPLNQVTAAIERVTDATGRTLIRKELRAPKPDALDTDRWTASADPRHWNYWRREAAAYQDEELRRSLSGTGLDLPGSEVVEHDKRATLWLEDVAGTPGADFTLEDHVALATGLGRWQASDALGAAWESRRFLRDYSTVMTRPSTRRVDDDEAWAQPLIREAWPADLRDGWLRLLAHRDDLLAIMERLPRTRCHLDVWVSNEIRRRSGEVVLVDWAFAGDGAVGEDLGNHVPDATFDLFWPAENIGELDAACFTAYLTGLREAGWAGREQEVRLGVVASCVKYSWLLPLMLEQASADRHRAYHQPADAADLYHRRGLTFTHLVGWCDEALRRIGEG